MPSSWPCTSLSCAWTRSLSVRMSNGRSLYYCMPLFVMKGALFFFSFLFTAGSVRCLFLPLGCSAMNPPTSIILLIFLLFEGLLFFLFTCIMFCTQLCAIWNDETVRKKQKSIHWYIWLIDWSLYELLDCLIDWPLYELVDWLIDWPSYGLIDWLTDYYMSCLFDWLIDRMFIYRFLGYRAAPVRQRTFLGTEKTIFRITNRFRRSVFDILVVAVVHTKASCPR